MTTIAYRDGVMASDSQMTAQNIKTQKYNKLHRLRGGALLGQSGDADIRSLLSILQGSKTDKHIPSGSMLASLKADLECILVLPNKHIWVVYTGMIKDTEFWEGGAVRCLDPFITAGSGGQLALGAMEAGASAIEAVKIACRRDTFSGLPVRSLSL